MQFAVWAFSESVKAKERERQQRETDVHQRDSFVRREYIMQRYINEKIDRTPALQEIARRMSFKNKRRYE